METLTSAKELTIKAMENEMLQSSRDPKEAAENVVMFYQTILNTINTDITASSDEDQ